MLKNEVEAVLCVSAFCLNSSLCIWAIRISTSIGQKMTLKKAPSKT